MNKELSDSAWAVLPKEFKEEVRDIFFNHSNNEIKVYLIHLFGHHNLTSDADEEPKPAEPENEHNSNDTVQKSANMNSNSSFLKKVEDSRRAVVVNRVLVLKPGTKVRVKDPKNIWHLFGGIISDVWPDYDHPEKTIVAIDFPEGSKTRCTDAFTAEDLRPF